MTEENGEKYGKGFALRMTVLLGLLALVALGFFYDRVILPRKAKTTIDEAYKLMVAPDEDGHGITKDQVQKTIGFKPDPGSEKTIDSYDLERYSFKRALPFMKGDYLNVIYENGALIQILLNQEYSPDKVKDSLEIRSAADESYTGNKVQLGGVPPSSIPGSEDEDSDEESDEDTDEESDEGTDEDSDEKAEGEKASSTEGEADPAKKESEDGSKEEDKGSDEKEDSEKKDDGAN